MSQPSTKTSYAIPTQLWGPPLWKVLYSLLFCAEEYIQHGRTARAPLCYPPVVYNTAVSRDAVSQAVRRVFLNLGFVLPCEECRMHTRAYFLRNRRCPSSDAVCQKAELSLQADVERPYATIQAFRLVVSNRLEKERCGHVCAKRTCSTLKTQNEITDIRLISGVYFMSKLDLASSAFFLSDSCHRRIRARQLDEHAMNHTCFVRGIATLLALVGWMPQLPFEHDMSDIMKTFGSFAPPNFAVWQEHMAHEIRNWMTG